jgi:hypothetical protein
MGWEQRGSHQYYYRKERESSRVKSIYVGRGELAELTAMLDAIQRSTQKEERTKERSLLACSLLDTEIGDALLKSDYQFRWLENSVPGRIERVVGADF